MSICIECGSDNIIKYSDDSGKCNFCGKVYPSISQLPQILNNDLYNEIKNKGKMPDNMQLPNYIKHSDSAQDFYTPLLLNGQKSQNSDVYVSSQLHTTSQSYTQSTINGAYMIIVGYIANIITIIMLIGLTINTKNICYIALIPFFALLLQIIGLLMIYQGQNCFAETHHESISYSVICYIVGIIGLILSRILSPFIVEIAMKEIVTQQNFSFMKLMPYVLVIDILQLIFLSIIATGTYFLFRELENDKGYDILVWSIKGIILFQMIYIIADLILFYEAAFELDIAVQKGKIEYIYAIIDNTQRIENMLGTIMIIPYIITIYAIILAIKNVPIIQINKGVSHNIN